MTRVRGACSAGRRLAPVPAPVPLVAGSEARS